MSDEIRILQVRPQSDEPFSASTLLSASQPQDSCRLRRVALSDTPSYVALSYHWGDTSQTFPVLLNDVKFHITQSVHAVLQLFRKSTAAAESDAQKYPASILGNEPLWIDAVCINQANVAEREAQVAVMRSIYASASRTLVWLGYPSSNSYSSELAMSWLDSIAKGSLQDFLHKPKEIRIRLWKSQAWSAVCDLLNQPWFRRRWVVQEASVSREVWVVYGTRGMQWERFSDAVERCAYLWNDISQRPATPTADVLPTFGITQLRLRNSQGKMSTNLLELLIRFRRSDSTRFEDRIFALLGLCEPHELDANRPDYSIGPAQVLKRFALAYIRIFKNLNILNVCTQASRVERRKEKYLRNGLWVYPEPAGMPQMCALPDLPTWVPNFTSFRAEWLLGPQIANYKKPIVPIFDASSNCPASVPDLALANTTHILSVSGVEIDRIHSSHPDPPIKYPDYSDPRAAFFGSFWNFASMKPAGSDPYQNQEARLIAFLQTITAGARNIDTDDLFSDSYLRYRAMEFFRGTVLEQHWHAAGLHEGDCPDSKDWYKQSGPDVKFFPNPPLPFDKLCFFKFVMCDSGRIALAPPHTQPGDRICVLFGCSSPLLLCESPNRPGRFELRGEAFVHSFMFGEAIEMWKRGQLQAENFGLV